MRRPREQTKAQSANLKNKLSNQSISIFDRNAASAQIKSRSHCMPRERRKSSSAARADARPAFSRPPGARAAATPPTSFPSQSDELPRDSRRSSRERRPSRDGVGPGRERSSRDHRTSGREKAKASPVPSPEKPRRHPDKRKTSAPVVPSPAHSRERDRDHDRVKYSSGTSTGTTSQVLSAGSLAKLNNANERIDEEERIREKKRKEKQYKNIHGADPARRKRKKNRNVSGAILEEGRSKEKSRRRERRSAGGYEKEYVEERRESRGVWARWKWWIIAAIAVVLLIVIIAAAVSAGKSKSTSGSSGSGSSSSGASSTPRNDCDAKDIPDGAKGTYLDISTWLDTADFNCTYTEETVGGLSVMGLFSDWDDSKAANGNVPPLNKQWQYGKTPIRGVNVGGWLSIEPFITPSLFNYPASANVVDEYTLTRKLGNSAASVIEQHYATFVTKQTFVDIANAGLDHVRIPYPYWAVTTYDDDPYVPQIAWRYLLRAIEWSRQCGLRVNLDLHALPGSQNGWTHSGKLGGIDWIMGSNGATNAQRSIDIHNRLSQFFAQDRYKNVVTMYGLVNEPKMLVIPPEQVVAWNEKVIPVVRGNNLTQLLVFGDGFLALDSWHGVFQNVDNKLVMDTHQYQIFNVGQLKLPYKDKVSLACSGWTGLLVAANNPSTG